MTTHHQEEISRPVVLSRKLGISGRIAQYFLSAQITPLIALVSLLPVSYTHLDVYKRQECLTATLPKHNSALQNTAC